jgi:mRNA-degrading endonuclease RelE of RelBE toxin-antitoxin system
MNTEYLPSFIKDLKKLKKTPVYYEIKLLVFKTIPNYLDITEINNLTKIKGHKYAYRLRIGNYRIGIFIKDETIVFSRVLHRKEIYRYFP